MNLPLSIPKVRYEIILLMALPWLFAINDDIWLFDFHGGIDTWLYLGFMLRLPQYLGIYDYTYYATRLSWILPGHLSFSLFPPLVAQYLLHIIFYYFAVFSLYFILKLSLKDHRSALLGTVLMGSYNWFLLAIGSNYVDGAGITYYLVTVLMLVLAAQLPRWRLFAFLGGSFWGLTMHSNLFWGALLPSVVLYYFFVNRQNRKNSIIVSGIFFLIGSIFITLVLGGIGAALGGKFLFFMPSVDAMFFLLKSESPWQIDWQVWLPTAHWLLSLVVTAIAALGLLCVGFFRQELKPGLIILGFQLCFLLNLFTFLIWEFKQRPTLQLYYYASYLLPSTFIAVGAQLSLLQPQLNRLKPYQFGIAIAGIIVISLLAFHLPLEVNGLHQHVLVLLGVLTMVWLLIVIGLLKTRDRLPLAISAAILWLLLTFPLLNIASTNHPLAILTQVLGDKAEKLMPVNISQRHDAFLITVQTQRFLETVDPQSKSSFWYNSDELLLYRSISSASMWARVGNESFPATGAETAKTEQREQIITQLIKNPNVVILSQQPDAFEQAQTSLKKIGLDATVVKTHLMQQGPIAFTMTFIQIFKPSA